MNYVSFLNLTKLLNLSFFMKFVLYSKNKKNLQKLHHFSSHHDIYAHVQYRKPKKGQQKVPILKKTTVLCPSRSYYSMGSRIGGGQQLGYIGKRSQKCSNFKEDDSVLPLYELLGARIGGGQKLGYIGNAAWTWWALRPSRSTTGSRGSSTVSILKYYCKLTLYIQLYDKRFSWDPCTDNTFHLHTSRRLFSIRLHTIFKHWNVANSDEKNFFVLLQPWKVVNPMTNMLYCVL